MKRPVRPLYWLERFTPEPWVRDAACTNSDPELWFPDAEHRTDPLAKAICAGCPVKNECLEAAMRNNEVAGIWGGLGVKERERLRKRA